MSVALPLTSYIAQGSARKRTNRVLSAQFGDGYQQDAPDGINNLVDEWSISYQNLTLADRNTVIAALDAVGSWDVLTWTPPNSPAQKFKVTKDGYSETCSSASIYTLSFNLRQVFA